MTLIDKDSSHLGRSWATLLILPLLAAPGCVIEDIILTPDDPPPNPGVPDASPWPGADAGVGGDAWIPDIPPPPPPPDDEPSPFSSYFDLRDYEETVQPQFDMASCGLTGCHNPLTSPLNFPLYDFPPSGSDALWDNFQTATRAVDLNAVPFRAEDTLLYRYAGANHFVTVSNPGLLLAWIEDAYARYSRDWDFFDAQVFEDVIQPMLTGPGPGCAFAACHDANNSGGVAFTLFPDPAPGSRESILNLRATTELVDVSAARAEDTALYRYATDLHFGIIVSDPAALASWIEAALESARP